MIEFDTSDTSGPASAFLDEHFTGSVASQAGIGGAACIAVFATLDARTLVIIETFLALGTLTLACAKIASYITSFTLISSSVHVARFTGGAIVILCACRTVGTTQSAGSFVIILAEIRASFALRFKRTCACGTV